MDGILRARDHNGRGRVALPSDRMESRRPGGGLTGKAAILAALQLSAELLPGGDYKLVVKSRAGDAGGPLQTSFRKVKYLRVVDPGPTVPTVTDIGEGFFHPGNRNVVTGENMRFADGEPGNHLVIKDGTDVDMEAMISTDTDVPVTDARFALNIDEAPPLTDGEEYTFEFAMVDSAGQPVTVTHTARWQSE